MPGTLRTMPRTAARCSAGRCRCSAALSGQCWCVASAPLESQVTRGSRLSCNSLHYFFNPNHTASAKISAKLYVPIAVWEELSPSQHGLVWTRRQTRRSPREGEKTPNGFVGFPGYAGWRTYSTAAIRPPGHGSRASGQPVNAPDRSPTITRPPPDQRNL